MRKSSAGEDPPAKRQRTGSRGDGGRVGVPAKHDGDVSGQYRPRSILLTGGAGFIGSHVLLMLLKKYPEYKIVNFDKLDYCSCLKNLGDVEGFKNYKFVRGNICSADLVNYVMKTEEIDTVLHFAAQTHVDNSFGNSIDFTMNNVVGTHTLLESAKMNKVRRFIHVSTDEVYGEGAVGESEMVEEHVLEPTNPYAGTKAAAEAIAKAYYRSFQTPVIITRGNNVYGPHQFPEKIIPKFINQTMRGMPLTVHGDGMNTRNYLFCTDVANAFDVILHRGAVGQVYNIGGTNEVTNLHVAHEILKRMGKTSEEERNALLKFVGDRKFNDLRYTIDSSKLRQLGWKEETPWEEGLQLTIDWYRKNSQNWGNISEALVAHPRLKSK